MVIQVNSLVSVAITEADGAAVFSELKQALAQAEIATVSFAGIKTASTSFVNTAFAPLLDLMSFEDIKRRVRVVESTRQINHMIKWRLEAEARADASN
jgi:pantothenate kinase-related protein Tda10